MSQNGQYPADASQVREYLTYLLVLAKDLTSARYEANQILSIHPKHVGAMRFMSDIESQEENLQQAVAWARAVVDLEPTVVEHRRRLIHFLTREGDHAAARVALEAALAAAPNDLHVMRLMRDLEDRLDRPGEAIGWARRILEINPNDLHCRERLERLLLRVGEVQAAAAEIGKLLDASPRHLGTPGG